MATQFGVDLVFRSQTQQLDAVTSRIRKLESDLNKLKGSDPFQGVENSARGAGQAIDNTSKKAKAAAGGFNALAGAVGKLGLAYAALGAGKFIFGKTAELETQTRSIQTLVGSLDKAKDIVGQLQQYANVTPFTSSEIIETAKRLTAFGVSAEKVVDTTKRLGDVAGATGANLGELSLAYGQVMAKGRLQGEELLQFQERGVALQDELRKMYGLTGEQFSDALSKGKISAKAVEVALQRLTDTGGKYAKGAISQSDSLNGKLSTLQDSVDELARKVGSALSPAVKGVIDYLINNMGEANKLITDMGLAWQYVTNQLQPFIDGIQLVQGALNNLQPPEWLRPGLSGMTGPGQIFSWLQRGRNAIGGLAARQRGQADLYGRYALGSQQTPLGGARVPTPSAIPPLLGGSGAGGAGGGSKADKIKGLQGRYIQGGYGPRGANQYGAHFDIKRTDGSYFDRSALDRYVSVNGMPLSRGVTVPGGQFGASRDGGSRVHNAWDYAFGGRAALSLQGGAKWQSTSGSSYGDVAVFMTPDGKTYRIIHGKFEKQGSDGQGNEAGTISDQLDAELKIMEEREQSLKQGQELNTQLTQQLELQNANTEALRRRLEIQYQYQERQQQINELLDAGQRTDLNALNDKIRAGELQQLENELLVQKAQLLESALRPIADENELLAARLAGTEKELEMKRQIAALTNAGMDSGAATVMVQTNQRLKEQVAAQDKAKASAEALAGSISSALTSSLRGLIDGSMTAEEALSNAFKGIGDAFLDMAMQMIQQWLQMQIVGLVGSLFGAAAGGGLKGFSGAGPFSQAGGWNFEGPGMAGFASGGSTPINTPVLVGERGPELFVPGQSGGITNHQNLRSLMASSGSDQNGGSGAPVMNMSFETVQIMDQQWVDRPQLEAAMAAASKRGAAEGERRALDRLKQSPSTRRGLGL